MIDDLSLHAYGLILRKLIYGIFSSTEGHSSGYSLPLSDDDRKRAADFREALKKFAADLDKEDGQDENEMTEEMTEEQELEDILEEDELEVLDDSGATLKKRDGDKLGLVIPEDLLDSLHRMLKPFLYPCPRLPASHSRWDDPLECFIALSSLSQTGNFKAAEDMTGVFAQLHYLIRSAIFYEAHHKWKNSARDLAFEEYVFLIKLETETEFWF